MDYIKKITENLMDNGFVDIEDTIYLILEVDRLNKALKKYGSHIFDGEGLGACKVLVHSKYSCTCGFKQALKE